MVVGRSRESPVPARKPSRTAFARFFQARSNSGLTPSSRVTSVTVRPVESTNATAARLNSAVYRFVRLLRYAGIFVVPSATNKLREHFSRAAARI